MNRSPFRPKIAVLWLARSFGVFALARRLTASRLRILCYHGGRIGDEDEFNPKLFCSADTFRARLDWLERKGFHVVGLDQAVRTQQAQRKPLETVITFDDGWYSTASALLPVLAERKLPSTLYLCTQHFLEGWPILNVATRYILWKSPAQRLSLSGIGEGADGEYELGSAQARELAARKIVGKLASTVTDRVQACAMLEQVAACAGVDAATLGLDSRRFEYMNPQELSAAAVSGCAIELHGHVHHYPKGEPERFRADLARCEQVIRDAGLPKPRHYCYPSGAFDAGAATVLAERGVDSGTTCLPGLVTDSAAPVCYYLPRFLDGESVHPLEFEAELSGFSHFLRSILRKQASSGYDS